MNNCRADTAKTSYTPLVANEVADGQVLEQNPESKDFYTNLLTNFVYHEFTEEQASFHWKKIVESCETLRKNIGRPVGIHTATTYYFTNVIKLLQAPLLVEQEVFLQTENQAMVDALTDTFNRRYMEESLKKELTRSERYNKQFSICLLDIDDFKKLNDTYGHAIGDLVLKELALCIKKSSREEDIVCRYGGEEFLIILPETEVAKAQIAISRISQCVSCNALLRQYKVTFSGGISCYPHHGSGSNELIHAADQGLYQAKNTGKKKVVVADVLSESAVI